MLDFILFDLKIEAVQKLHVVASEAKQSAITVPKISGLLRRYAPRKDVFRLLGQPQFNC